MLCGVDYLEESLPQHAFVHVENTLLCTTYGASWVLLCCDPALASKYIGSVAPWLGLPSRPRSAAAFDYAGCLVGATK